MSELACDNMTPSLTGPWWLCASVTYQVHGSLGTQGDLENLEYVGPGSEMGTRGASWNRKEWPVVGPPSLHQIQSLQIQVLQELAPLRPRSPSAHSLGARLAANPWCPVGSLCSVTLAPRPQPTSSLGSSVLAAPHYPECTASTERVIKGQSGLVSDFAWESNCGLWCPSSSFPPRSSHFLLSFSSVLGAESQIHDPVTAG